MFLAILITVILVVGNVSLHLGVLRVLKEVVAPRLTRFKRIVIGVMVLGAIIGHLVEIAVFALGMGFLASQAEIAHSVFEPLFWSATAYTSLGSDYPQIHEVRVLAAVEALTGLILITWTASLLFLLMQKYWAENKMEK